jgi:DNA-binding XRE family transcriptional regulator
MEENGCRQEGPGGAHRRVLWRGKAVFVAEPSSAITDLLARFAAEHPDQVTALSEGEIGELAVAPALPGAALPIAWGKSLREIRRERDLSQRGLAEMAGVGVKSIIRCELGDWRPTHKTIQKVSRALELQPDEVREFARVRRAEAERIGLTTPAR